MWGAARAHDLAGKNIALGLSEEDDLALINGLQRLGERAHLLGDAALHLRLIAHNMFACPRAGEGEGSAVVIILRGAFGVVDEADAENRQYANRAAHLADACHDVIPQVLHAVPAGGQDDAEIIALKIACHAA